MSNRGKKHRKRKHEYPFIGLMKCASCGCAITAERQKGHVYYRCTKKRGPCDEKYLREENLVGQFREVIQKVALPDDGAKIMLEELNKEKFRINNHHQAVVQNLQEEKRKIALKLDQLLD